MNPKTAALLRGDATPSDTIKLIRGAILEAPVSPSATSHQLNADSHDCMAAMKTLNDKLSQHIEHLCFDKTSWGRREDGAKPDRPTLSDSQAINRDKMATALHSQLSYYEAELRRLEEYRTKITQEEYLTQLNAQTTALKTANALQAKEINDARLRLNALVAKEGREQVDKATRMQDLMLKAKNYEEKIARTEDNPDGKEAFLRRMEEENRRVSERLEKMGQENGHVISKEEFEQRKKASELVSRLDRLKKVGAQTVETLRKQAGVVQHELDKLKREEQRLEAELQNRKQMVVAQSEKVMAEERKTGVQISDVKHFIFQERRNQHSRDVLRQSEVREREGEGRLNSRPKKKELNKSTFPSIGGNKTVRNVEVK